MRFHSPGRRDNAGDSVDTASRRPPRSRSPPRRSSCPVPTEPAPRSAGPSCRMVVAAAVAACWSLPSAASSHREAPFIATQPQVDATDFYMFRSYEPGRDGYVTIVANYLPLQDPYGGPNYFKLDPNALYEIHVINDGGAVENITFTFRFQNTLADNQITVGGKMVSIPLAQNGSADVSAPNSPALNVHETYTLDVIRGPAQRHHVVGDQRDERRRRRSTSRSTTSARRRSRATSPTRTSTSATINIPGCDGNGPRVRRPAQGSVRREPRRNVRPRQHQVSGDRAQSARRIRDDRFARRRQRHVVHPRGADRVPDPGQGHRSSAAGRPPACRRRASRRSRRAAVSTRRRRPATSCRCRGSACRSSTRSSSASRTRTSSMRASRRTTASSSTT